MDNKTSIDLNSNQTGIISPNDPDYNKTGQVVTYSYSIKYIRIKEFYNTTALGSAFFRKPNATEQKEIAIALVSDSNAYDYADRISVPASKYSNATVERFGEEFFAEDPNNSSNYLIPRTRIVQQFSDNQYTYYKYDDDTYAAYFYKESAGVTPGVTKGGGNGVISKKMYNDAKQKALRENKITYEEVYKLDGFSDIDPASGLPLFTEGLLSRNRPVGVRIGDRIVIVVENNIGLPTYYFHNIRKFRVGNMIEEQCLQLAIQAFNHDPPVIKYPSAGIWSVDENSGDIIIEEDYEGQRYPPQNSEVIFADDNTPISYTFTSKVVDKKTKEPIIGATITDSFGNTTQTTNNPGTFTLKGTYNPDLDLEISISKPGQNPIYSTIFGLSIKNFAGGIRDDINFIELESNVIPSSTILKSKTTSGGTISRIEEEAGDSKNLIASTTKKITDDLTNRTTPYIIDKLLYQPFGITDPIELIRQAKKNIEAKRKQKRLEKKEEEIQEFNEYFNRYEFDPNYIENQRRIRENDFPTDDLELLPVPTPGYVYVEEINRWIPEAPSLGVPITPPEPTELEFKDPKYWDLVKIDDEFVYVENTSSLDTESTNLSSTDSRNFKLKLPKNKFKIRNKKTKSKILKTDIFGRVKFRKKRKY